MAAISQKIFGLIGGVSQQPDTIKAGSQLRVCDNYYPDTATGLTKRPGLRGISKLANAVADGTWFPIFRDDQEKYIIQFSKAGALKIWSADSGLQQTVNAVAAESIAYATHESADEIQTLQINDYIFVLNRTKTVAAGTGTIGAQTPYAFVSINTVAYNSKYFIEIDNINFSYTTPVTTSSTTPQLNVKDIVSNLVSSINADANYVAQGIGNIIHIKRANDADFAITARGGNTGTSIDSYKGAVTSVGQLPKQFINNLKIKVSGSAETGSDDYWVIFKTSDNTGSGTGTWEETIGPGVVFDFNEETMPHVIIREANGTFTYRQLDEASAGSTGPTSVAGIVTAVVITGATSGGHVVGERFAVTGGTGDNLRLQVTKVQSLISTSSTAANSSTYVRQISTTSTSYSRATASVNYGGFSTVTTTTYKWYRNGAQIGSTSRPSLNIGKTVYTVNGAFQKISNQLRAGLTITTTTTGVINAVSIVKAGQGYTATNIVQNRAGDSFTITAVNTAPLEGDASRLNFWKYREVGDSETNPMPTFVGYPIDAISFYKNRIVFTSRQNVICSQAGDYFNFFASTVITIVDSDPIDLSASTLKPIRLKHAIAAPQGLLLFGDNAQLLLSTTTEAFSPKTAEVNLLSTLSQTDRIAPLDIGSSYMFLEEGEKASSIYEMILDGGNGKPAHIELTRFIPTYIPAAVLDMQVSQSAGTMAIFSKQELSSLYLYRWFNLTGEQRIAGWFRWMLPGTIEFFTFDHDILFVVTKHGSNYVLSKMSLLTDTPSESLLFEGQYLDVRLDLFDYNPTLTYDSVTDLTHVCFKDGFEDLDEQPVLVFLNPDIAGYFEEQTLQYDASKPVGEKYFLTVEGNETTSSFAIGYKYEALAQLPAFYVVKDEARNIKDTVNVPRVSRLKVNSYNSGPYRAVVRSDGRDDFVLELPQITANNYLANNIPIIRNAQSTIPVMAKGDQFEFELIADSPFQTAFTSIDWEGTYDNKGIKSV
jgi:hypothetical protein